MMTSSDDFGYTQEYQQRDSPTHTTHAPSEERPKLYGVDATHSMMQVHDYHHPSMLPHHHHHHVLPPHTMTPHHVMTPQHHLQQYEHEPLPMHVPQQYYGPGTAHMLLVSSDYGYHSGGSTASVEGTTTPRTNKRSREDLNMKEKKRMFKLNDRINQLKEMLDEAGIQCKKNKQSVLDNAVHFIDQLRSDLVIAKQKADRSEKEAEVFKAKAKKATKNSDSSVLKGCFTQSSMARIVVDLDMKPVSINAAFLALSGQDETFLQQEEQLKPVLCADKDTLDAIVKHIGATNRPSTTVVEATTNNGRVSCMLLASPVANESGKTSHIEFSLIPTQPKAVVEMNLKPEPYSSHPSDSSEAVLM